MAINFKILSDSINSILCLKKYHIIESIVKQKIIYIQKCFTKKLNNFIFRIITNFKSLNNKQ